MLSLGQEVRVLLTACDGVTFFPYYGGITVHLIYSSITAPIECSITVTLGKHAGPSGRDRYRPRTTEGHPACRVRCPDCPIGNVRSIPRRPSPGSGGTMDDRASGRFHRPSFAVWGGRFRSVSRGRAACASRYRRLVHRINKKNETNHPMKNRS